MVKGQVSFVEPVFVLLLTGVLAGTVAVLLPTQIIQVTPDIETKELENRALLLANSILGNRDLIYSDGNAYYRGIFDVNKLNTELFTKGSFKSLYLCIEDKGECKISTYPDSYALIIVSDIENNKGWFTGLHKLKSSEDPTLNIVKCFQNKLEMGEDGSGKMFEPDADLATVLELEKCNLEEYSIILNQGFPVPIRYSDTENHIGLMKVVLVE